MLLVLVVLLHDLVGLPAPLREAFKEEVALLMGEAGIAIQITDCAAGRTGLNRKECIEPTGRGRVRLVVSPGRNEKRPEALGTSFFRKGHPANAFVYVSRVREVAADLIPRPTRSPTSFSDPTHMRLGVSCGLHGPRGG